LLIVVLATAAGPLRPLQRHFAARRELDIGLSSAKTHSESFMRNFLEPVLVMQPTKNGCSDDSAIFRITVALRLHIGLR
jgi:hypothetical protein